MGEDTLGEENAHKDASGRFKETKSEAGSQTSTQFPTSNQKKEEKDDTVSTTRVKRMTLSTALC